MREGTAVGWGALTVAVVVSHGIGGDPAREGSTGADAPVAFVAGAEVAPGVVLEAPLEAVLEGVIEGVGVVLAVGETVAADDGDEADAAAPELFEQPARPASSTSAMPAPPRRAPMRERAAVTGERLPRGLRVYRGSEPHP